MPNGNQKNPFPISATLTLSLSLFLAIFFKIQNSVRLLSLLSKGSSSFDHWREFEEQLPPPLRVWSYDEDEYQQSLRSEINIGVSS